MDIESEWNLEQAVESVLDRLFTNGANEKADRLLLIQEAKPGAAKVTDAAYLGGYNRPAVRGILRDALTAKEQP